MGDADFMLTVDGAGFVPGSVVRWNGEDRPTSYISSAQVMARIAAVDRAEASTVLVS
ncbi:MAG: hypothetical protein HC794_09615, partial [Nitrospiraceae bacterium]|nr:hypothetical protein [Nitrospiraceae bacterium]